VIPAIAGAIGPLGPAEWSVGQVGGAGQAGGVQDPSALAGAGATNGSFSSALTGAIDSLDQSQGAASTAATQLADGQANDPTKAVTAVENASLSMDLASQITSKLVTDLNTLYQTQV
jgi:flagellar hook-basal body complex protein FliE